KHSYEVVDDVSPLKNWETDGGVSLHVLLGEDSFLEGAAFDLVGDGVTDNSDKFAAITAWAAENIRVPEGNFYCSGGWVLNGNLRRLTGAGRLSVIFPAGNDVTGVTFPRLRFATVGDFFVD